MKEEMNQTSLISGEKNPLTYKEKLSQSQQSDHYLANENINLGLYDSFKELENELNQRDTEYRRLLSNAAETVKTIEEEESSKKY